MHEYALAEAVISTALKESEKEGLKKITKIKLKIGELQQIDIDTFKFILNEVIQPQSSIIKEAKIELKTQDSGLKCRVCGHKWTFKNTTKKLTEDESESIHFIPEIAHIYIRCPECKSPDFEIVEGRGVWIDSIEGW